MIRSTLLLNWRWRRRTSVNFSEGKCAMIVIPLLLGGGFSRAWSKAWLVFPRACCIIEFAGNSRFVRVNARDVAFSLLTE